VRLYSAPQLHCTIVAIPGICASDRRFSSPELCHNPDPQKAARKLLEIANETEPVQTGRIHIENLNGPFLFRDGGSPEPVFRPRGESPDDELSRCAGPYIPLSFNLYRNSHFGSALLRWAGGMKGVLHV
jgi:hypothetical protein